MLSFIPLILAAGSFPTLTYGAPVPSFLSSLVTRITPTHSLEQRSTAYTVYGGTGLTSEGWPAQSAWLSFDALFEANTVIMADSCTQWGVANNSDEENTELSSAIQSVASSTGIDARFILAIVMQESNGCVRAPTTNYGVTNPGLMQSHDGAGSCNNGGVQNPCPASEITQMITDGTAGTSSGDGLKQCLSETGATDVSMYYKAARIYNSGSIDSSKNLGAGVATHCYASDVANRLLGWTTAATACNANTIGSLTGSSGGGSASSVTSAEPTTTSVVSQTSVAPTTTSVPEPTTTAVVHTTTAKPASQPTSTTSGGIFIATSVGTVVPLPSSTSTSQPSATSAPAATSTTAATSPTSTGSSSSSDPIYPYAVTSCQEYYDVVSGDICINVESKFGITLSQLQSWNSGLDDTCSNLWLGYKYCVKA